MDFSRKLKIYFFPILALILPACFGLYWEIFNRHYRGIGTPLLLPAIGLLLISLFFWTKKRWAYLLLVGLTLFYLIFFFRSTLWQESRATSIVYYYQSWKLDTLLGQIQLKKPIGPHPPASGGYISCNFNLKNWLAYFNTQPVLCTAFDDKLRLKMFLNDAEGLAGSVREFQINYFSVDRKSLLGEPLDRWALRIAFSPLPNNTKLAFQNKYQVKAIYQVFEREIAPGKNKIVESFSRNAKGKLKSFTESPLLKFSQHDVYALYGPDGGLIEIPRMKRRNYSFPAKIDMKRYEGYELPRYINP